MPPFGTTALLLFTGVTATIVLLYRISIAQARTLQRLKEEKDTLSRRLTIKKAVVDNLLENKSDSMDECVIDNGENEVTYTSGQVEVSFLKDKKAIKIYDPSQVDEVWLYGDEVLWLWKIYQILRL